MKKLKLLSQILQDGRKNIIVTLCLTLVLGIIDWSSGYEFSFQFFYFIPLGILASNENQKKHLLVIIILFVTIVWFIADFLSGHSYSGLEVRIWNTFSRFIVFTFFTFFLHTIVKSRIKLDSINKELSRKNIMISESIQYARSIQNSVIPDYKKFHEFFPESFLYTKPKDVLSGDFFWSNSNGDRIIFALVDCTGHGIPGALLSVIGIILLNKIVLDKGTDSPSDVLTQLNIELQKLFDSGNEMVDDGMEITVVQFDRKSKEMIVAQTSNSTVIIGIDDSITVVESDIYTIGGMLSRHKSLKFNNYSVTVENNSMIYLFSDGFPDQFGAISHEKYGVRKFHQFLKNIHNLPLKEQYESLKSEQIQWQGENHQTDDITVIGIKFDVN